MKFMVLGDTHGNLEAALNAVDAAVEHQAEIILQVGDFGFVWPRYESLVTLETLNDYLKSVHRRIVFVDGNHEDHDALNAYKSFAPRSTNGHVYIRSHILWSPRGNAWTWAGKRFASVGGAVSIDKQVRLYEEQNGEGKTWWAGEQLTGAEAQGIINDCNARRARGKANVDYLFTHECSDKTPWRNRLKPDLDSKASRQRLDEVMKAMRPRYHFHGHMHEVYDWMNPVSGSGMLGDEDTVWCQTYGLACDGFSNNWGLFDTDLDTEADPEARPFSFEKELTDGWNRSYFERYAPINEIVEHKNPFYNLDSF